MLAVSFPSRICTSFRLMATVQSASKLSHQERTADALRQAGLHRVTISHMALVNPSIRLFNLTPVDPSTTINFLPGQWLDVFVPGVPKAGGFTITSAPHLARPDPKTQRLAHLELAVQKSPRNPPAAWLWQSPADILGARLVVRVGGDFVWPPRIQGRAGAREWSAAGDAHHSVVMVAGGVGINPLVSMLMHIVHTAVPLRSVTLLYATKAGALHDGSDILFLPRILECVAAAHGENGPRVNVKLFLTPASAAVGPDAPSSSSSSSSSTTELDLPHPLGIHVSLQQRRLAALDVEAALPADEVARWCTVCYICGPPAFTDSLVAAASAFDGMHADRVLCEKWW